MSVVRGKKEYQLESKTRNSKKTLFKKNKTNNYDCIVPVSGGKDGSYVCHI